jgi:hypothetical protein
MEASIMQSNPGPITMSNHMNLLNSEMFEQSLKVSCHVWHSIARIRHATPTMPYEVVNNYPIMSRQQGGNAWEPESKIRPQAVNEYQVLTVTETLVVQSNIIDSDFRHCRITDIKVGNEATDDFTAIAKTYPKRSSG